MNDLISRQAAIDALEQIFDRCEEVMDRFFVPPSAGYDVAEEALKKLPSAQPEHKTGHWIPDNTDYYRTKFICSACGESEEVPTMGFGYAPMWGYCPNCGADMRGEKNG